MQGVTFNPIDSGIQDILYLYNSKSYSGMKKLTGCQSAFLMRDLPLDKKYQQLFSGSRDDIAGVCRVKHVREKGLSFHAVICAEDMLAIAAVKYARMNRLEIPSDLSVIGYNNSLLTICSEPELTSVDNRLESLCQQLVKTLIDTLGGNEMPQKTIFSGELVKRGTTAF